MGRRLIPADNKERNKDGPQTVSKPTLHHDSAPQAGRRLIPTDNLGAHQKRAADRVPNRQPGAQQKRAAAFSNGVTKKGRPRN